MFAGRWTWGQPNGPVACRAGRSSLGFARVTVPTVQDIADALVVFINDEIMAPGHAIDAATPFVDAGIDSMALLKVLLFVERTYGCWVPDEDLVEATVASATTLARYLAERSGGA